MGRRVVAESESSEHGERVKTGIRPIFEALADSGVPQGFWSYYETDPRNVNLNPQETLFHLISNVVSFLQPEGLLLSVGCGYGIYEVLLSFLSPSVRVVGIDILDDRQSSVKISTMKEIVRRLDADRVTPLLADGGRLPFRDASFDCSLAIDCLSHADYTRGNLTLEANQALILEEMSRVVRPNGLLAVVENNATSPVNVVRKGRTTCHPVNPYFLKSILRRLGYERVDIAPYYDLSRRTDVRARVIRTTIRRSGTVGLVLAPFFLLRGRKGRPSTLPE